ncbi:hypothetical protein [Defluviimonas salinarum]|uniref:PH domain-containing protein n=1 Tax=Defluviimonas salinarum TaxID=2992147 RepID=A0ABT3J5F6_9RHOB|nr:hypothetical protein [Defluviimonas salinarum]MCW3782891.1 hypothetical protein [Defluviimonas salinarum]
MRASREYRKWINHLRRRFGKASGVIPGALLDCPAMERKRSGAKAAARSGRTGRPAARTADAED